MESYENKSEVHHKAWSADDITIFDSIDPFYIPGIIKLLQFVVMYDGVVVNDNIDLTMVFSSVINSPKEQYSFEQTDSIVAVACEFCLINTVHDKQILCGVEILDNSVIFLALVGEYEVALDAAICLSKHPASMLYKNYSLPSLALFGEWERIASTIIAAVLSQGSLFCSMTDLFNILNKPLFGEISKNTFVTYIKKLCDIHLLSLDNNLNGDFIVGINPTSAGLFLLFCDRVELAAKLAAVEL